MTSLNTLPLAQVNQGQGEALKATVRAKQPATMPGIGPVSTPVEDSISGHTTKHEKASFDVIAGGLGLRRQVGGQSGFTEGPAFVRVKQCVF